MFVLHWLVHQLYLTWIQLTIDITIPHIITALVLYKIVHTAARRGHVKGKQDQIFKSLQQWKIYNHVWVHPKGKIADCSDCATVFTVDDTV